MTRRSTFTLFALTTGASAVIALATANPRPAPARASGGCVSTPQVSAAVRPGVSLAEAHAAIQALRDEAARFQPERGRWGSDQDRGTPVTLTYSFVPDGTMVDGNVFLAFTEFHPSVLHARLDALFGSEEIWKQHFRDMFDDWAQVTGNTYIEVEDDGGLWQLDGPFAGQTGRGDIRIGMVPVTPTVFFAYNEFPERGNMVLDSNANWGRFGDPFPEWRNVLAHEHGHGLGLTHVCPQDGTKLMEPLINTAFIGPQLDDVLSAQYLYGDRFEPSDAPAEAVDLADLGLVASGAPLEIDTLSIDSAFDTDVYRVASSGRIRLSLLLEPVGSTYPESPQTSECDTGDPFDALRLDDLRVDLIDPELITMLTLNASGPGEPEQTADFPLDIEGDWFIRVAGQGINRPPQAYRLTVSTNFTGDPADLSGDGCVDAIDLASLVSGWGTIAGDVTGDGATNAADLAALIAAWSGPGC